MSTRGLQAWTKKLLKQDMPVLGAVIAELNQITGSDEASVNQLAEVILRDPNLTSHVLRIANSVRYNYGKTKINTVSRAIVLIGLKGVRAICISIAVMDSLLGDHPREQVLRLVARGFHGATQARNFVDKVDDKASEEVFVAGLLYNLGEMAFWATEQANTDHPGLCSDDPRVRREAMEEVLGTSFKSLTRELAKHWKLGELLEESLSQSSTPSVKARAVITGERLSRAALYGWDSPQLKKVLREVMTFTGQDAHAALAMVREGADQAASAALSYGVAEACPLIPTSSKVAAKAQKPAQVSKVLKGDPSVQLSILRELSAAAGDNLDVNTIFQMVLEGMHRGVGLERVAIAFIDKHKLRAKYVLGEGTEQWRTAFLFDIGPYAQNLFTWVIEQAGTHWLDDSFVAGKPALYDAEVVRILGKFPAFLSVLQLDERKVGLFYADRSNFGGKLDEELFESFRHFSSQAQQSLTLSKQRQQPRAVRQVQRPNSPW